MPIESSDVLGLRLELRALTLAALMSQGMSLEEALEATRKIRTAVKAREDLREPVAAGRAKRA